MEQEEKIEGAKRVSFQNMMRLLDGTAGQYKSYTALCKKYLSTKKRDKYYDAVYNVFTCNPEGVFDDGLPYSIRLTDEQVEEIKSIAYKFYETDEWDTSDIDCDECTEIQDLEYLQGYCELGEMVVTSINVDTYKHFCTFTAKFFNDDLSEIVESREFLVEIDDEQYIETLVEAMVHPPLTFMQLRSLNPELFNKICVNVEGIINNRTKILETPIPNYLVELTEINEDVAKLQNNFESKIFKK